MNFIRVTILTFITILSLSAQAQRYEIGINGGATGYMGDINSTNPFYFKNIGGGLFVKYNLNPTWGVKLSANHLLISGNDLDFKNDYQQTRGLLFRNQLSELSLTMEFNFWTYYDSKHRARFTPYILGGIGAVIHDPYLYYDENKIKLRPLKLEYEGALNPGSYSNKSITLPMGVGFKYRINSSWSVGVEASYRLAFTDYLDNVSKYYPTSEPTNISFPNVTVGPEGNKRPFDINDWKYLADPSNNLTVNGGTARGDGRIKDGYMTAGITLIYTIFDANCFDWIKR